MARDKTLRVTILGDARSGQAAFKAIERSAGGMASHIKSSLGSVFSIASGFAVFDLAKGAVEGLAGALKGAATAAAEEQAINDQTAAAIKSTGDASGMTAQQISELGHKIQGLSTFSNETVQQGENMLLTFCLQSEAQALARGRGWISHEDLNASDEILAYDPDDGSIRWEPVESMHRFAVNGDLTRWKSKQLDVMTTPRHRWWTTGRTTDRMSGYPVSRKQPHTFRTTEEISGHQFAVMIGGGAPACFLAEAAFDDDLVELLGWVVTEGWFTTQTPNHVGVGISQSQTANPQETARIRALVERFNARGDRISETQYQARYNGSTISEWHFAGRLGRQVRELLPSKKLTTDLVESLTEPQARLLLEVMLLADGSEDLHGARQFIQKDPEQIGMVALLCGMLGIRTSTLERDGERDSLYLCKTNYAWGNQLNARPEHYEGVVWCPHLRTGSFSRAATGGPFGPATPILAKTSSPAPHRPRSI